MKKTTLLLFFCMSLAAGLHAQEYQTAFGAKFYTGDGSVGGLNIRHSTAVHTALEGSLLFFRGGAGIEGLYEYQGPVSGVEGLQYFVGGGGLLGFGDVTTFALRLTGGIDYKFAEAPIDISIGLDPFFNISPSTGSSLTIGIGLRYVFK
ncbi:MAG: hypothetical protein ABIR19_09755 [Ginsengibacter sp.]